MHIQDQHLQAGVGRAPMPTGEPPERVNVNFFSGFHYTFLWVHLRKMSSLHSVTLGKRQEKFSVSSECQ